MRPRLALAAVLVAASAAAIPSAHAANSLLTPYCATNLHNAAAGASASCATQGPPPVECVNCGVVRTVDIVVAKGAVDATLFCDNGLINTTTHVDGPGRGQISVWGGYNCTTTLTATADGTTAVATSTGSYVVSST